MRLAFAVRLRRDVTPTPRPTRRPRAHWHRRCSEAASFLLRYPPSLFRTLRAQSSCIHPLPPHLLLSAASPSPSPSSCPCHTIPSSVLRLFPSQRVPPPFRHPCAYSHHQVLYIYYITPFPPLSPRSMWTSPYLPLYSLSPSTPPDYVSAPSFLDLIWRTTYVPCTVFLLRSLSACVIKFCLRSLRVPAAFSRFVEIYSHPLALSHRDLLLHLAFSYLSTRLSLSRYLSLFSHS